MINHDLLKYTSIKKAYFLTAVLQPIFNSAFTILSAFLLTEAINSIFIKRQILKDIQLYILLFILSGGIKCIFNYFADILVKKFSEEIKESIKADTFNLILSAVPSEVSQQDTGEVINILTEGSEMLTPYYSQYIPQFFSAVLTPFIICIFVAFKDRLSALLLLITYPVIPFFMSLIGYKSKEKNEQQWQKLIILSSHLLDVLQGLRTLKVFGRSKIQEKKVYEISENYRKSTMEVLKVSFLSALVLETSATISTAVIAVNLGLRLVFDKLNFLTAFFILIITPEFYIPLRQLGVKYHISLNGQVAIDKIALIKAALKRNISPAENPLKSESIFSIEIKNLSFSHKDKENLSDISFEIYPHEKIALVGESGSGKSTLINILSGFLKPGNNMVFINKRDINSLNEEFYTSKIAIVPQAPHIFNMSIEDNILLGSSMNKDDFITICKLVGVSTFAEKFKNKYKTLIGEGQDIAISGGEKQKIALARALVKKAEIIILDEPTSALDPETEEQITYVINNHMRDKIVITAAHRLNTIKAADKIMVLSNGELIESGSHVELLNKKGKYYNMLQTSGGGLCSY